MLKYIKFILLPLLFLWELPQNVFGLTVLLIMKRMHLVVNIRKDKQRYFIETPKTGVSLGWFVFWTTAGNRYPYLVNDCRMHEYGHARQSLMLGPLYLVIVGIPSVSRVLYRHWYRRKYGCVWKNYFHAFPENWADRLGGIEVRAKNCQDTTKG